MKSCFSLNKVLHKRFLPKKYNFLFKFFWFHIHLSEIEEIEKKIPFFSYNKWNIYSLFDQDHWYKHGLTIEDSVKQHLIEKGVTEEVKDIVLVTSLRVLGYVFNPVSYYFVETVSGLNYCLIEISNTFNEMKPILIPEPAVGNKYHIRGMKNFYVSPFTQINEEIEFHVKNTQSNLSIVIHTYNKKKVELTTILKSVKTKLSNKNLFLYTLRYPLITVQIIAFIHIHALILFMKGLKYKKKSDDSEYQQGVVPWRL